MLTFTSSLTVSKLVTPEGQILVPGLMDLVEPLTEEERARYEAINATVKVRILQMPSEPRSTC
jgi:hypothetical protein